MFASWAFDIAFQIIAERSRVRSLQQTLRARGGKVCEDVLSKIADDVGLISLLQTPTESPANSIAEMRKRIQQLGDEYATLQMKRSKCLLL